jgi:outer membrane protein assembly factor BamB
MKVRVHDTDVPGALEIVSLTTAGNGRIYGGYTGAKDHLFIEYDPARDVTRDLGSKIVSANELYGRTGKAISQKIHHALEALPDGRIAGATGTNVGYGSRHFRQKELEGGHVFVYDPGTEEGQDLGVPIPHNWIIAGAADPDGKQFFGMTYHHNDFFAMDLTSGEVVFADQVHAGVWGDSACCHQIACDNDGVVYGSCSHGYLFTYDSKTKTLTETDAKLPGEGTFRIDSAIVGSDGLVYAATWETGIVFSIEPGTLKITQLCQPNQGGPRLPGLTERDGVIYGAAGGGRPYRTRDAFLFEYDTKTGSYKEIGPIVDEDADIVAIRVHAMTTGQDGTLYAGETGNTRSVYRPQDGDIEVGGHAYLYIIDV